MPGGLLTFRGRAGARRRGRTDQFSILLAQSCQLLLWGAQRVQCLHQQCDLLPCKAQEAKACTLFSGDLPRPRSTLLGLETALHNYALYCRLNWLPSGQTVCFMRVAANLLLPIAVAPVLPGPVSSAHLGGCAQQTLDK